MDDDKLLSLVLMCIPLSLVSFGGGQAIVAGLQNQTVEVYGWMNSQQFTDLFAVSRAAPGPSTLIVALIGWQIGGLLGAIAATLAIFIPSSLLIGLVGRLWLKRRASPWVTAIERGLIPIAVGLIFAGFYILTTSAGFKFYDWATIFGVFALLWYTKVGPYTILAGVGCIYGVVAHIDLLLT